MKRSVISRPSDGVALAVDGDELRRHDAGPFDIARRLDAEHEGRQRDHILHIAHFNAVVARHRRFDGVAARLRGRLDRRVEGHARGAAGVGALVALQHGGGFELALAGKARVGREEKALAPRRREHMRKLRGAPFDRTLRHEAAGEIAREEIDVELAVERDGLRRVEHDLEGRQPIGLLLERELPAGDVLRGLGRFAPVPRRFFRLAFRGVGLLRLSCGASGSNFTE